MSNKDKKSKEGKTAARSNNSELYKGSVRLEIESLEDYKQVNQLSKFLKTVDNLHIESYNWSEDSGLMIVVSLQSPMPLGSILSQMPMVEQVYKKRKNIVTVLNTAMHDMSPIAAPSSWLESPVS